MKYLNFSPDSFVPFLLNAKRQTYAALGDEATVPPLLPDSHQLEYWEGEWFYRDVYFGGDFFVGQETVYHRDTPVWAMCYAGGLLPPCPIPPIEVYLFLRAALRAVTAERPYRGPDVLQEGNLAYEDESQGSVERFWGMETITYQKQPVYQLRYGGGFILP